MCPTCGKAFRVRANYYKHRKIHERSSAEQQQQDQQQNQNEQIQGQHDEGQQTLAHAADGIHTVGDDISNVTPQTGLLENFTVCVHNLRLLLFTYLICASVITL